MTVELDTLLKSLNYRAVMFQDVMDACAQNMIVFMR
jgi:hypothetical protein